MHLCPRIPRQPLRQTAPLAQPHYETGKQRRPNYLPLHRLWNLKSRIETVNQEPTADEAHKPHETDLIHYLHGIYADPFQTVAMMPRNIYRLLHDLRWIDGFDLTEDGLAKIAGG